jgi:hypothetical protein
VNELKPPSLAREVVIVAWYLARVTGTMVAILGLLFLAFRHNVIAGVVVFYVLLFGFMIGFTGWQSYKWKRESYERPRS